MLMLTDTDREWISAMRKADVLANVDAHLIDPDGTILVTCADADQFPEIFVYKNVLIRRVRQHRRRPRIHTFVWNGGALRLVGNSPINRMDAKCGDCAKVFVNEVAGAISLKNIWRVALYMHAPCGKAHAAKLDFYESVKLLLRAKDELRVRLRASLPEESLLRLSIALFCHIDYGKGRKRTYYISRDRFMEWHANLQAKLALE